MILADLFGLFVLAGELTLFLDLPLCRGISWTIRILIFAVLAGMALYVWRSKKLAFSTPSAWLALAGASILIGSVSFVIDVFVGSSAMHNPAHSFLSAADHAGSPLGFPLTVLICPSFTMIAIAGSARSFMLPAQESSVADD
jgi:hypothetical protein